MAKKAVSKAANCRTRQKNQNKLQCRFGVKQRQGRKMPGRFAEGPRHPGFILPASAVSEQETFAETTEKQL